MKPFGIAATLHDAVALAAGFGAGQKIGIGAANAAGADILAPAGLTLTPAEIRAAAALGHPQYLLSFANTGAENLGAGIGPLMEALTEATNTGFLAACLATPWLGRTAYQGHLFQNGSLLADELREFGPHIPGRIGIVAHNVINTGSHAIRAQLTAMKEHGVHLALLDAIDDDQCGIIAEALLRQPIIAGPAWISPQSISPEPEQPGGPIAILSGALHRNTLLQIAAARSAMPAFDLDFTMADLTERALAWARPHIGKTPFIITSSAPPDKIRLGNPAAAKLAQIAAMLAGAGITRFVVTGNDTATAILTELGIRRLTAGAFCNGLRWLRAEVAQTQHIDILIKPGGFGARNLFLHEFEPQSRLNEPAV